MTPEFELMLEKAAKERIRYFPLSTFLGLLAAMVLVIALGLLAYRKLDLIVNKAAEATQPNHRHLLVKELVSHLYDAENEAITYSISRDETHLRSYHIARDSMRAKLEVLLSMPKDDSVAYALCHRLGALIGEKQYLMQEQLNLQSLRTDEVLDELSRSLQRSIRTKPKKTATKDQPIGDTLATINEPAPEAEELIPEEQQARAIMLYRWMMGIETTKDGVVPEPDPDKPKVVSKPILATTLPKESIQKRGGVLLPVSVEKELEAFKKVEAERYRENLENELQLTLRSQEVSSDIRNVVVEIEQHERKVMATTSAEVGSIARTANNWIVFFCVGLSAFLLLLAWAIIIYFKTTKRHQLSIVAEMSQAEALADARARFLATMTHEIRTPMNAIVGFSHQLLKTPLQPAQQAHLRLVQRASDHLIGIVNAVLDYSRLDAGQMVYEKQAFELDKEISLVLDLLRPGFDAKGIQLEFIWRDRQRNLLSGDALRLRQILLNLLNNSLKFTEKGSVALEIQDATEDAAHPRLHFIVRDTGMGIPAERLDAIFKAFEQSDASISRKFGGSGLGLTITKMLVEQQGGEIGIASEEGTGTTIWFGLPFDQADPSCEEKVTQPAFSAHSLKGKVALIADDEPFNRKLLREILEGCQMVCKEAANGLAAMEAARAGKFDIVFMDYRMPEMDGLEATRQIRKEGLNIQTPVLLLSATTHLAEIASFKDAGCNVVLAKPFREEELLRHLVQLTGGDPLPPPAPRTKSIPTKQFSLTGLQHMGRNNPQFLREMVLGFIEAARQGQKAIQMAFEESDHAALTEAAHKLAGPAKHLAATALYDVLKGLESAGMEEDDWEEIACLIPQLDDELATLLPALLEAIASDAHLTRG
jgi:signal transduction histidine kinase/DNA-binding NarL/FixJ family response regulator